MASACTVRHALKRAAPDAAPRSLLRGRVAESRVLPESFGLLRFLARVEIGRVVSPCRATHGRRAPNAGGAPREPTARQVGANGATGTPHVNAVVGDIHFGETPDDCRAPARRIPSRTWFESSVACAPASGEPGALAAPVVIRRRVGARQMLRAHARAGDRPAQDAQNSCARPSTSNDCARTRPPPAGDSGTGRRVRAGGVSP